MGKDREYEEGMGVEGCVGGQWRKATVVETLLDEESRPDGFQIEQPPKYPSSRINESLTTEESTLESEVQHRIARSKQFKRNSHQSLSNEEKEFHIMAEVVASRVVERMMLEHVRQVEKIVAAVRDVVAGHAGASTAKNNIKEPTRKKDSVKTTSTAASSCPSTSSSFVSNCSISSSTCRPPQQMLRPPTPRAALPPAEGERSDGRP
jgi:hypothetical protein